MRRQRSGGFRRRRTETTLALINIVFLMLVFFLVAGRIAPSTPAGIELVKLGAAGPVAPADTLAITADGRLIWRGAEAEAAAYLAGQPPDPDGAAPIARLMPDRDLPAERLVAVAAALRAAGAGEIRLVAERAEQ